MGNGMNKIFDGLYLGNFRDARDANQLADNKITHILSIHDNAKPLNPEKVYLCLQASDMPNQNISQYFSECNDFIHSARLGGGTVLVHCLAGVSRSASIVVAYVMTVTNLTFRQALDAVRGARRCVSPNFGFQRQLLEFELEHLAKERARLCSKFGEVSNNEQEHCEVLLNIFIQSEQQMAKVRSEYYALCNNPSKDDSSSRASDQNKDRVVTERQPNGCSLESSPQVPPQRLEASSSDDVIDVLANHEEHEQADIQDSQVTSSIETSATCSATVTSLVTGIRGCSLESPPRESQASQDSPTHDGGTATN